MSLRQLKTQAQAKEIEEQDGTIKLTPESPAASQERLRLYMHMARDRG
jgi:hypothetical protein